MRVRTFSAGLLLALLASPTGGPGKLEWLSPTTFTPIGHALRISWFGYAVAPGLAVHDGVVVVPTRTTVGIVDTTSLRFVRSYRLPRASVCVVDLDGSTPFALVGCGRASHRYAIVRLDPRRWIPLRRLVPTIRWPVSYAVGDGKLFVARAKGAGVDVVDLHTGAVSFHEPRRSLAKGGDYVQATWLGDHLLGLNGTVVDVRTWRSHTLSAHARELVTDGSFVATYGSNGVAVFTRPDLRLFRRFLRGQLVDQARIVDGILYARVALIWERFDVRTGRELGQVFSDDAEQLWLL